MALEPVEAGSATRNDDVDVLPFINEDICDAVDAMEFPTGYHLSNEDTSVSLEGTLSSHVRGSSADGITEFTDESNLQQPRLLGKRRRDTCSNGDELSPQSAPPSNYCSEPDYELATDILMEKKGLRKENLDRVADEENGSTEGLKTITVQFSNELQDIAVEILSATGTLIEAHEELYQRAMRVKEKTEQSLCQKRRRIQDLITEAKQRFQKVIEISRHISDEIHGEDL